MLYEIRIKHSEILQTVVNKSDQLHGSMFEQSIGDDGSIESGS